MGIWRNNRLGRKLGGWLAIMAIVANVGFSAFSGPALAIDTTDGSGEGWPFGAFVICTSDGIQTGNPVGDEQPTQRSAAGECDFCPSGCCAGMVCRRMGSTSVQEQTPYQTAAGWLVRHQSVDTTTIVADFSIRAPPYSA